MATAGTNEYNFFKGIFLINAVFVFFLFVLLFIVPSHTQLAEIYAWFFASFLLFLLLDMFIISNIFGPELLDTITFDYNPKWFLMQRIGTPLFVIFIIEIIFGLLWGGAYFYSIYYLHSAPFISVPNFFTTTPVVPFFISAGADFEALEISWTVATTEQAIFTMLMFPVLWAIIYFVGRKSGMPETAWWIISMLIAAPIGGLITSNVIHSVVYQGDLYAYADATGYFTIANLVAGVTGSGFSGIISHAMHNWAVKLSYEPGAFAAMPPPPNMEPGS